MTSGNRTGGESSYLGLLRDYPGFRLLFTARSISLLGDWFSLLAAFALVRELTGSDSNVLSGLLILKLLPIFLAGPLAGVVADRFHRKTIMVVSELARVVFVLLLLAVPFCPRPLIWTYGLILLQVVASAFFEPARGAALPQLVPDRALSTANAMGAIAWSVMFALGAASGGLVTDLLGWRFALVVDAGTYVVSASLVARIRLPRRERRPSGPLDIWKLTGITDFVEGIRFIAGRASLITVMLVKTGWGVAGGITLLLTLFGERIYPIQGRPDLGIAALYVARAVGTGIGPWLVRRFLHDETAFNMRWLLTVSFLWAAGWYAAFSWVDHLLLAASCVVLAHLGGSVLWVYSSVLVQRMAPDAYRGRVMSAELGLATMSLSLSTFVFGLLADLPDADLRGLVRVLALAVLPPAALWHWAAGRWPVGR